MCDEVGITEKEAVVTYFKLLSSLGCRDSGGLLKIHVSVAGPWMPPEYMSGTISTCSFSVSQDFYVRL
jgi:hypothetical protein